MSVPREVWNSLSRSSLATRVSIVLLAASLIGGVALRTVWLDQVPPGLHHDEACDAYDAYSILLTGRDHHGNLLPVIAQGFNDYRMVLFDYSLVPLIGAFGLKPAVVRLGAAIWGSIDLVAVAIIAALTLGLPAAAIAVLLGALSPWHLALSRYGIETTAASATVSMAMACFFLWLRRHNDRWLLLSAAFFGLSLYSYAITRAFTPLMILFLAHSYEREIEKARGPALAALGILVLFATPHIIFFLLRPDETLAPAKLLSIIHYPSTCPGCIISPDMAPPSLMVYLRNLGANWLSFFTPSFLFLHGDRGDHWTMVHPSGFGQLLPAQALLIGLSLIALLDPRRRKLGFLLFGWLLCATLPAALTIPLGIWNPEPGVASPSPWMLIDQSLPNQPLSASILLSHPDSRHAALAMVPWTLLSALGFVVLLDLIPKARLVRGAVAVLLLAALLFSGAKFVKSYFRDYPSIAAPYFSYGMDEVVRAIRKFDDGRSPVVITDRMKMPYIFVLFFQRYNPSAFQRGPVFYGPGYSPPPANSFAPVIAFDRYRFGDPGAAFSAAEHGIFVFARTETLPTYPALTVRYPDGSIAYNVVVK